MSIIPFMKMLGTVMKHLIVGSPCKMYPARGQVTYENTRGQIVIDVTKCIRCTLCAKKCPTGAIAVDKEAKTWTINRFSCILCAACVECCPKKCLSMSSDRPAPAAEKSEQTFKLVEQPKPTAKPDDKGATETIPQDKEEGHEESQKE